MTDTLIENTIIVPEKATGGYAFDGLGTSDRLSDISEQDKLKQDDEKVGERTVTEHIEILLKEKTMQIADLFCKTNPTIKNNNIHGITTLFFYNKYQKEIDNDDKVFIKNVKIDDELLAKFQDFYNNS